MNIMEILLFAFIGLLIFLTGAIIGMVFLRMRIKRIEAKQKELDIELLQKRTDILKETSLLLQNLEKLVYQARVAKEIDDLTEENNES